MIFGAVEIGSSLGLLAAVMSIALFAKLGAVAMILGTAVSLRQAFRGRRMHGTNRQTDLIDIGRRPVEAGEILL